MGFRSITTNKANGGDVIPAKLFKILKDDAVKVLHSICQQIWKTQQRPQDWKRLVFISITKKGNAKECSKYPTVVFISHAVLLLLLLSHFSHVQLLVTLWTVARQASQPMGFSRQEYWSGLHFLLQAICIGDCFKLLISHFRIHF